MYRSKTQTTLLNLENQPANKLKIELPMVLFWLVEKNPQQLTNNKYFKFPLIFHDSHSTINK